jgi:hypothetical protein
MDKQTSRLLYLVAGVWALNIVAGMIPPLEYEPDGAINGVFTAIASLVFVADKVGNRGVASRRHVKEDDEEEVK